MEIWIFGAIALAGVVSTMRVALAMRDSNRAALELMEKVNRSVLEHLERNAVIGGEPRQIAERKLAAQEKALEHRIHLDQADAMLRKMRAEARGSAANGGIPLDIEHRG